jgi:hypothetical protein
MMSLNLNLNGLAFEQEDADGVQYSNGHSARSGSGNRMSLCGHGLTFDVYDARLECVILSFLLRFHPLFFPLLAFANAVPCTDEMRNLPAPSAGRQGQDERPWGREAQARRD